MNAKQLKGARCCSDETTFEGTRLLFLFGRGMCRKVELLALKVIHIEAPDY